MDANNAILNTTDQAKKTRSSRGRQRIEIKKLEVESKRQVTFSKRRKGLFNKAKQLSTLCGAEVGILTFSKAGRVYATENMDAVLDRFLSESSVHGKDSMLKQKEVEEKQETNSGFGLDQRIENLGLVELMEYAMALQDLREKAAAKLEELSIQNSTCLWPWVVDEKVHDQFMIEGNFDLGLNSNNSIPDLGHVRE